MTVEFEFEFEIAVEIVNGDDVVVCDCLRMVCALFALGVFLGDEP